MRYQEQKSNKYVSTLKPRIIMCVIALMALCTIRFTPDDTLIKTKNAIRLVLTRNTDCREEMKKLTKIFHQDEGIASMAPVAEFVSPAEGGKITVRFGAQDASNSEFHYGVDIKLLKKQNVTASASGKITEIANSEEYGSYIIITHNDEISTLYGRLNEIFPDVGEEVEAGKPIARANDEDDTIHFEIRRGETYLDPCVFIDFGE